MANLSSRQPPGNFRHPFPDPLDLPEEPLPSGRGIRARGVKLGLEGSQLLRQVSPFAFQDVPRIVRDWHPGMIAQ